MPDKQNADGSHISQADRGGTAIVGDVHYHYGKDSERIPFQLPNRAEHFRSA